MANCSYLTVNILLFRIRKQKVLFLSGSLSGSPKYWTVTIVPSLIVHEIWGIRGSGRGSKRDHGFFAPQLVLITKKNDRPRGDSFP